MKKITKFEKLKIELFFNSICFPLRLYNKLKKILLKKTEENYVVKKILFYPKIKNEEVLADYLNRIAWWLPNVNNFKVYVLVSEFLLSKKIENLSPPLSQENYLKKGLFHVEFINNLKKIDFDIILLHNVRNINDFFILKNANKVLLVDKNHRYSYCEATNWLKAFKKTFTKQQIEKIEEKSKLNFSIMIKENKKKKKAYCFASGPSLDDYKKYSFSNESLKIICNAVILNNDFIKHMNGIDIIAFIDLILFFSSSKYTAMYLKKIVNFVNLENCFIVTKMDRLPILLSHYPELESYVIGVKNNFNGIFFPLPEKPFVKKGLSNVLSTIMIPIASRISEKIYILGADGKNPNQGLQKRWNYSKNINKEDIKKTTEKTHPSKFLYRNKKLYYKKHCMILEELLSCGEKKGKEYYTLTNSYIPALNKRKIIYEYKKTTNQGYYNGRR